MRRNSLAWRLTVSATLWSVLALLVAGLILISLYRQTVERAFDERLDVYLKTLVAALGAQEPGGRFTDPGNLGEARFELLYSGWYWQVRASDTHEVLLGSKSLFTDTLDLARASATSAGEDDATTGALAGPDNQALRFISRPVTLEGNRRLDFVVAGDAGELWQQIVSFGTSVAITLAAFGIGLVVATLIQIRWGLRPLDQVRQSLGELRGGRQARIEGAYPAEISPLVNELNALLESNQEIIDRARTQVGNLAHALKTPLSVITNEARANRQPFGDKVAEQAELMRRQVNHYLDRARIAAQFNVVGVVTDVEPVVDRLLRVMTRLHDDRGIKLISDVEEGARFRGEQQDLEEIVGNLVDNACKWTKTRVSVQATVRPADGLEHPARLVIRIDDDGPGLTPEQAAEAIARGHRLDESKPGSGLGLSIVSDLVAMYRGHLRLDRSRAGGLCAEVELPAA